MRTQSPDTSPEAERVLIELLRQAPAWRKLRMVEDTNRSVKDLLMTGLRHRFPQDSPTVLRRRLAELWLGTELAAKAYGPPPEGGTLDRAYLEEWASELGVTDLLRRALDDVGLLAPLPESRH